MGWTRVVFGGCFTSSAARRPTRSASGKWPAGMLGAHELTRDRSSVTRGDVLQALAEGAPHGASIAQLETQADAALSSDRVVALAEDGDERYTTRELLEVERDLLDAAERQATRTDIAVATPAALDASLDSRPTIEAEQRDLVAELTRGGKGIAVVRAAAGTGKTFALDAAREAWERSGVPVLGCALSARAACELRDQAGMDATTIARLAYALDRGLGLARDSVLVVDEAGMVGTRDLARLADAAAAAHAKLVLVGDDRQLPEIQAGGAFRALAERAGAVELRDVRRQRHAWDRSALAALRAGDVERFVGEYQRRGRIVAAATPAAARTAVLADWWQAHLRGDHALMIAHRRRDVAELNAGARDVLRAAGHIGDDELVTPQRAFAVGDRVIAGRNDPGLGVVNRQAGTLDAITADRLVVAIDGRAPIELPRSYAEHGSLDHAYAITAHRAQGTTVDRAFVLGSSRAQQLALTGVEPQLRRAIDPLAALGPAPDRPGP